MDGMVSRLTIVFVAATTLAWLITGAFYMHAIGGEETHPDIHFMGAVCVFCPLVGLLASLVTARLNNRGTS
jgi:hypothetical protein